MEELEQTLTKKEVRLLKQAHTRVEREQVQEIRDTPLVLLGGALFILLSVFFAGRLSFLWVMLLSAGIPVGTHYFILVPRAKRRALEKQQRITDILSRDTIRVRRYQCSDALVFETWMDQLHVWVLQVSPTEVMIWPDHFDLAGTVLPAKQFDVVVDSLLPSFHGRRVTNPQGRFPGTVVPADLVGNRVVDFLPVDQPGAILQTTLDKLLAEAKRLP